MIIEVPTGDDFCESGVRFLNLAWDGTVELLLDLNESSITEFDEDGTITDDYWARAQLPLSTAVTLAQQGAEFLVKARIADVSPFLLFSGSPRDWPKGCEQSDCSYAEFRTLDAQDLTRVHDAVSNNRLSQEFKDEFERMRRVRNSLVHTISKSHRFSANEVLKLILRAHRELASTRSWMSRRLQYLEMTFPGGAFPSEYGYEHRVARELRATIDALTASDCKALLNINKKQRFYYCVACHISDFGLDSHVKTAQLMPNSPGSTMVHCFACETQSIVKRTQCSNCPGNVIDDDAEACLSCGSYL